MALNFGWNFRATSGFVTDAATDTFDAGATAYPNTYTNGNGQSINAGYTDAAEGSVNRVNSNDPRLAGVVYTNNGGSFIFKVDLSSGNGNGAAAYDIYTAGGDGNIGGSVNTDFQVFDDTSALTTRINHQNNDVGPLWWDGNDTTDTDGAAWNGAAVNATFTTTTCILKLLSDASHFTEFAHLRLVNTGGGGTNWGPLIALRNNRLVGV